MYRQRVEEFMGYKHGVLQRAGRYFVERIVPVHVDVRILVKGEDILLVCAHGRAGFYKMNIDGLARKEF